MTETKIPDRKIKFTRADFVRWGATGGSKSRRVLTPEQARMMVAAREAKRKSKQSVDT